MACGTLRQAVSYATSPALDCAGHLYGPASYSVSNYLDLNFGAAERKTPMDHTVNRFLRIACALFLALTAGVRAAKASTIIDQSNTAGCCGFFGIQFFPKSPRVCRSERVNRLHCRALSKAVA